MLSGWHGDLRYRFFGFLKPTEPPGRREGACTGGKRGAEVWVAFCAHVPSPAAWGVLGQCINRMYTYFCVRYQLSRVLRNNARLVSRMRYISRARTRRASRQFQTFSGQGLEREENELCYKAGLSPTSPPPPCDNTYQSTARRALGDTHTGSAPDPTCTCCSIVSRQTHSSDQCHLGQQGSSWCLPSRELQHGTHGTDTRLLVPALRRQARTVTGDLYTQKVVHLPCRDG